MEGKRRREKLRKGREEGNVKAGKGGVVDQCLCVLINSYVSVLQTELLLNLSCDILKRKLFHFNSKYNFWLYETDQHDIHFLSPND